MIKLQTEQFSIDDLQSYEKNAKKHPKEQVHTGGVSVTVIDDVGKDGEEVGKADTKAAAVR